jgi:hypothetical protein
MRKAELLPTSEPPTVKVKLRVFLTSEDAVALLQGNWMGFRAGLNK